ncbi:linker for activation of T-cells family member 1-like [Spea bombifrons]|uniref:linker for activation of T-cells family member 1-like n=1 Tax=Spea bombifrons TaxID=233779 RepID=UPI00234B8F2B|nr:linker for activation of T-cells family member 1-like [Spea bombifrons]
MSWSFAHHVIFDGAPGFRNGSDSGLLSVNLIYSREDKAANDEDDYEDNENYNGGYIQVIPNESDVKVGTVATAFSSQEIRDSMSSVATDDNYVNVDDPSKARAASSCANDDNYVNVGDQSESEDTRLSECLEYVNVEDSGKHSSSDSEDEHDYENVESRKSLRSQRHSSR